jgi:uncharacterized delta-60 repeat protein
MAISVSFAKARPGDLDLSFGAGTEGSDPGTFVSAAGGPGSFFSVLLVQADGKIIAAGNDSEAIILMRLRPDGTPDPAFGEAGRVALIPFGRFGLLRTAAIQPDGKILAAWTHPSAPRSSGLVRFLSDGDVDTSFGVDGIVTANLSENSDSISSVTVRSDGRILGGGGHLNAAQTEFKSALFQYLPDGSPDEGFGVNGVLDLPRKGVGRVAVQPDGKILVGGIRGEGLQFVRREANGAPDLSFGRDGILDVVPVPGATPFLAGLAVQSDGRIVAAGSIVDTEHWDFYVMRFFADGSPDTTLRGTGTVVTDVTGANPNAPGTTRAGDDFMQGFLVQSDGKLVAAGHTNERFVVVRYLSDGNLDPGFGTGGVAVTAAGEGNCRAGAVAVQADGKIIAGGSATHSGEGGFVTAVVRYQTREVPEGLAVEWPADSALPSGGTVEFGTALNPDLSEKAVSLTLRNTGSAPLRGIRAALSGRGAAHFLPGPEPAPVLAAGDSTILNLRFVPPPEISSLRAVLTIQTDQLDRDPYAVVLHGATDKPVATLSCYEGGMPVLPNSAVNFGPALATPAAGLTRRFTIRNTGNIGLTIQSVSFGTAGTPGDFAAGTPETTELAPNEITAFPVLFSPSGPGPRAARLRISSTDTLRPPLEITLQGTGATGLTEWRLTHFGTSRSEGPAADLSDPDNDGIPNLLEYATLTPPREANQFAGNLVRNGALLEYTVTRPPGAEADLTYSLEWSGALQSDWVSTGVGLFPSGSAGMPQMLRFSLPAGDAGRRFVRLRVIRR